MALLSFPPSPINGQLYPTTPAVGQSQYQWDSVNQTWELLGAATGVIPGTYGDSTRVAQFTVNAAGQLTSAANVPIANPAGGTVTEIGTGVGLLGGPITQTGTIAIDYPYLSTVYIAQDGGTVDGGVY